MTNETRNRIEAYKKVLPEMKERAVAAAFLMVMSVMMMASASFAWLTISRRPEVTGVNTSIAANGNLEIALATSNTPPGESKVGDSSAAEGQNIIASNITWGNLVNLTDASYGLEKITLRPAQLNRSDLLGSPLFGASYQDDGRVYSLDSSFAYTKWVKDNKAFLVTDELGVRAISSTKMAETQSDSRAKLIREKQQAVDDANTAAGAAYTEITTNKDYMNSLAVVMGTFMTARMNAGQGDASLTNPTVEQKDVINLTNLFKDFLEVSDLQFEALTELANYQLFLKNGAGASNPTPYTEKTVENIKAATEASLKKEGLQISGLNTAKSDYQKLVAGYEKLQNLSGQGAVKWADSGIDTIVNSLMDVAKCKLDSTPIGSIGASNASGYLDGKTHNAYITNGVLFNFEKMNGTTCYVEKLSVSAKVKRLGITIPASITVNIQTTALMRDEDSAASEDVVKATFFTDTEYAEITYPPGVEIAKVAQDTYGLALDVWVRTNASGSYLTLEGNVLTESESVRSIGKDYNGNEVELYSLTRSDTGEDGETISYTMDLYKVETTNDEGEAVVTWYNADSHATVTLQTDESGNTTETPLEKYEDLVTVIGYEGENRVFVDNSLLPTDSTTQGSGSCYVYYADSPEDQARSLKLLDSMNVAFVDAKGKLLATAGMDTERYFAENGRVTVPLVLQSDSYSISTVSGEEIYTITPLTQNEPMRITALVYLNGTKLSNEDVLSASEIDGQLNIQFGSSAALNHANDEPLQNATRSVSASVDNTTFDYVECKVSGTPMTTNVTVTVQGEAPTTVEAFFIRKISSTQGSREEVMTFTKQEDTGATWTSAYEFTAPGNYVLRSVKLDGQTYDLATCPEVTVTGFALDYLTCEQAANRHVSIMTADDSYGVNLSLQFKSSDEKAMPKTVQGRFLRDSDGNAVNINFTHQGAGIWTGQATFISSGDYTLEYLVLDGEYMLLDEGMIHTAAVYLGMKTAVYTDSPTSFKYDPEETEDNKKNLYMKVEIMDNTGKQMEGLQGAHLYYLMEGSSVVEKGYDADLIWDAAAGCYTCTFASKVGVFKFSHVTVGGNTIDYAETSPVFRVISPEPPSYEGFTSNPYVYSATNNISMNVRLSYSSTATVAAMIRNTKTGETYEVEGTRPETDNNDNNEETWLFLIPSDASGKQDGHWQLDEVRVWNYYDADGNYIEAELDDKNHLVPDGERDEPLVFNKENSEKFDGNVTKAVNTVYVTVNGVTDAELGKDENGVTGEFMASHTISGLSVTMADFEGEAVSGGSVTLGYTYNNDSQAKGGYISDSLTNALADIAAVTFNVGADGKTYTQSSPISVQYAGSYKPVLICKIGSRTINVAETEVQKLEFSVHSVAPTVTITGIAPMGTFSVDTITNGKVEDGDGYTTESVSWCVLGWSKHSHYKHHWTTPNTHVFVAQNTQYIPQFNEHSANVYFKCLHADKSTYGGTSGYHLQTTAKAADNDTLDYHEYTQPTVSITLANIGNASNATLAFKDSADNPAHIYGSQADTTKTDYTWTANGAATRYIGLYGDSRNDNDTKTVAGTVTAEELKLTYNDIVYTVDLPTDLTIINNY